jgi:hypothetical protein
MMCLESGSTLLKAELLCGNLLSEVGLLQNFTFTDYRDSDFGAVYVDAHPVRSYGGSGVSLKRTTRNLRFRFIMTLVIFQPF